MDDYLNDFIRESEENINELNNALLDLEDDPEDEEAMDMIFRTAHTLKGNFGAMGFHEASDLAHAIEDLLDEMREGEIEVTPERMDLIFEGVDGIEAMVAEIEEEGETSLDPSNTIEALRNVIDEANESEGSESDETDGSEPDEKEEEKHEPEEDETTEESSEGSATKLDESEILEATRNLNVGDADSPVYARVSLGDSDMPGIDAMLVLEETEEAHEILDSEPGREQIEDGEFDDHFELVVDGDEDELFDVLDGLSKTETVEIGAIPSGESEESGNDESPSTDKSDASTSTDKSDASTSTDKSDASSGSSGDSDDESKSSAEAKSADKIQSIRVDVDQLDDLHGLVEELVTSRIKLTRAIEERNIQDAEEELDELGKISSSLQDTVMDIRLVPLKKIVTKFPRLVRDLARSQDKEIDFEIEGDDIELDRTILNEISDPLMHLLRNAVDHGIESPEEREAKGKPREGKILLKAERERDKATITVEDDGRGLDVEDLKDEAVEEEVMSREEVEELEDSEVYDLIFHSGFSTTEEVTDVSGRGVGMDVVRNTINRLDGTINVESERGEGTTIELTLPVTVAIVKILFVESGDEEYGIPTKNVDEISQMKNASLKQVEGKEVITHDDTVYPVVRLGTELNVPGAMKNGEGMLVRIKDSVRQVAIHCDNVVGQEEVVVKPFEGMLSGIPGLSGAAVLGEGKVVTILDVETL